MSICKFCNEEFLAKSMGIHVVNCKLNPKYKEFKKKRLITNEDKIKLKNSFNKLFKIKCYKCEREIEVIEDERTFPKKDKYYCSRFCANSRGEMSNETKKKISSTLSKKFKPRYCKTCNIEIKEKRLYCSDYCRKQSRSRVSRSYRYYCNFDFDVNDYPEYFDLSLIEEFGLYSPTNSSKGSNLNGVSKDHLLSISEGQKHNISPEIMKHPANCRLVRHNENISKGYKSLITLGESIKKIEIFDRIYTK